MPIEAIVISNENTYMGIAKKRKRKIIVNDSEFYWYVAEDYESLDLGTIHALTIASDDKKFIVKYPVQQKNGTHRFLIVLGKKFGGTGKWGDSWQRVKCPIWEVSECISPKIVREIILWSLSKKEIIFVDYKGSLI